MTQKSRRAPQPPSEQAGGIWLLFAIGCGLLAAAPLWGPGIVATRGGGDSPFLLQRTLEMAQSLRTGIFPVRWMSHAAYDLGYPFYNYYAALPYYISGGLTAAGINILSAIQATQSLGFALAAVAAGLWARCLFRSWTSRALHIVAYTFTPFHLVNVYVRGDSLSEFYAFIWFPLILWALDRLVARPGWARVLAAACSYGALIVTHNISALIFSPLALGYALALTARGTGVSAADAPAPRIPRHAARATLARWGYAIAPFVLGIALSAWFWLPAVAETSYGQMGTEFTEGYFHYSRHFRGLNLVQPSLAFDYSVAGTVDAGGAFTMGLTQAAAAMAGVVAVTAFHFRSRRADNALARQRRTQQVLVLGSFLLATFMTTPLSKPVWDHLPLLPLVQFPWRFLSIQALFAATLVGAVTEPGLLIERLGHQWAVTALMAVLLVLAALLQLSPDRLLIAPEDVTWKSLGFYEAFTGNTGTTIRYEYLPEAVVPRLYIAEAVIDGQGSLIAAGGQSIVGMLTRRTPTRQTWIVSQDAQTAPVAFPINWWPGWQAEVDGVHVVPYPTVGSGRLTIDIPPGDHTVELQLRPTHLEHLAGLTSVATAIAAVGATVVLRALRLNRRQLLRLTTSAATVLLSALVGPVLLQRAPQGSAAFFDFVQLPFPHHGPIDFGSTRLLEAQLSAETVAPGDKLSVALKWDGASTEPLTATLRLVSPAAPRHGVDITLSQASAALGSSAQITLPLPDDLARGLYLVELTLAGTQGTLQPSTPEGHEMGMLYVGAVRVPNGPSLAADVPVIATFEDLRLLQVEVDQPHATELLLRMHWSTAGTPRNWSLSVRILGLDGHPIVQQDLQPGYGYLPTTLWHANERIVDSIIVPLPEGLAPGDYTLRIITYLEATMHTGGEVDIPLLIATPTLWDIRSACYEQTRKGATILCETGEIALLGLDVATSIQEGEDLDFTAEWNALRAPTEDLEATWTLVNASGQVVSALEAQLATGSRTSTWPRLAWVLSPQHLDLPQRQEGSALELHLQLSGTSSGITDCGRVASIDVVPRPRVFSFTEPTHPQRATYGDVLVLLGYDLDKAPRATSLLLTLWWRAEQAPTQDLKRFIHLYKPGTDVIETQDDAMPRGWTYPTTLWVAGEVVSETVTLDLGDITPGTYELGLGWYDPTTSTRLAITAADTSGVQSDRLTLDTIITVEP